MFAVEYRVFNAVKLISIGQISVDNDCPKMIAAALKTIAGVRETLQKEGFDLIESNSNQICLLNEDRGIKAVFTMICPIN